MYKLLLKVKMKFSSAGERVVFVVKRSNHGIEYFQIHDYVVRRFVECVHIAEIERITFGIFLQ